MERFSSTVRSMSLVSAWGMTPIMCRTASGSRTTSCPAIRARPDRRAMGRGLAAAGAAGAGLPQESAATVGGFLDCGSELPAGQLQRSGSRNSGLAPRLRRSASLDGHGAAPSGTDPRPSEAIGRGRKTGHPSPETFRISNSSTKSITCWGGAWPRRESSVRLASLRPSDPFELGGKTETAAIAQWMIGESYFHQKSTRPPFANTCGWKSCMRSPPGKAELLQAAKCHEALGEWPQAVELYARLLKTIRRRRLLKKRCAACQSAQQQVQVK